MSRQDAPMSIPEIEQALAECRREIAAVHVPDVAPAVRRRIELAGSPAGEFSMTGVRRHLLLRSGRWGGERAPASGGTGLPIDGRRGTSLRREALKFVAGGLAFVVLAGMLVLAFRSLTGGPADPAEQPPVVATATVISSPTVTATEIAAVAASPTATATEPAAASTTPAPSATLPVGKFTPSPDFALLAITISPDWRVTMREIQPVDPLTLEPLPEFEPFELEVGRAGGYIERAVSPDGRAIALVAHAPGDGQQSGKSVLHLIDFPTWQMTVVDEWDLPLGVSDTARPRFSPDGSALYWVAQVEGERTLMAYELETGVLATVTALPPDFRVIEYAPSLDRSQIAVIGVPVQGTLPIESGYVLGDFTTGDARLLLIDLDSGTITQTVQLDGVVAGAVGIEDAEGDNYPVHGVSPGISWDLDGNRLYIAHADEPRVTVVDLERGAVDRQLSLERSASLLDRFIDWLFPSARAVGRAFSSGHAVLTDDGERLAVAMNREYLTLDRQELEEATRSPVWLIDTGSGDVLWEADLGGVHGMALTPDGARLLVHTFPRVVPMGPQDGLGEHRLILLDLETGEIVQQVSLPGWPISGRDSLLVSRELVYLQTSGEAGSEVLVLDPASLALVGRWQRETDGWGIYALLPVP